MSTCQKIQFTCDQGCTYYLSRMQFSSAFGACHSSSKGQSDDQELAGIFQKLELILQKCQFRNFEENVKKKTVSILVLLACSSFGQEICEDYPRCVWSPQSFPPCSLAFIISNKMTLGNLDITIAQKFKAALDADIVSAMEEMTSEDFFGISARKNENLSLGKLFQPPKHSQLELGVIS